MSNGPWGDKSLLLTTTNNIDGRPVRQYLGIVAGETILGANIFRDIFASFRDIIGGRSSSYENVFRDARSQALAELADEARRMGADAVIGVQVSSNAVGANESMLMVTATGTAVKL